ncbi:hypothetical protein BUALT_Bualt04G0157200 [Buddleja alternifolia]|uniref:TOG domain-containing protein n=1 Tax=Buddleja alternifolia TaxID=168488 RepID=A0AAV6XW33_9LAMI|nr:hypothetical protein BUALT_Bualt04G0157200 [Buddleja alternifolia]
MSIIFADFTINWNNLSFLSQVPIISVMSENALRDVSKILDSERTNGNSSNGNLLNPQVDTMDERAKEKQKAKMPPVADLCIQGDVTENTGAEVANPEVEYIESQNLKDVEDVENCLKTLLSELGSKDWITVCDALNNVRKLSIYHKEGIVGMLNDVISLIVKSLKNPRSALCKTAIMTCADIFKAYNEDIIDALDPLLLQLLLKSSQDKRFVCEAAEKALIALTSSVSPHLLLPKLQPYVKHRNHRIRAKASMCITQSVPQLGVEGIEAFGIDNLIQIGASQLSDKLPESRDAARTLLLELKSVYEKTQVRETTVSEGPVMPTWEHFCQSKLSALSAQAVLRVTNTAQEVVVSGS